MNAARIARNIGVFVLAICLLGVSGTMAWAAANDYSHRGVIPEGTTIAGQPASGLTEAQARTIIAEAVTAPALSPVTVSAAGQTFTLPADGVVTVDVEGMIDEAFRARREATFGQRLRFDVAREPAAVEVGPRLTVATATVEAFVRSLSARVETEPVDAAFFLDDAGVVQIRASAAGRTVDTSAAVATCVEALTSENRSCIIPVASTLPTVTEDQIPRTIVVDISERTLRLFEGARVLRQWSVAVGTPGFPTPKGEWEIVQKRKNPTWRNPGSDWAKDMPPSIAPGPSNPLGVRALNLNASGIRIHGTNKLSSIGTAASHGCMRMRNSDIKVLFDMVPVGTKVFIVR